MTGPEGDDTVIITPRARRRPRRKLVAGLAGAGVLAAALALWLLWPRPELPPPVPVPLPQPAVQAPVASRPAPPAAFALQTASEDEIRNHSSNTLTLFRFAANPNIVVADFPTLLQQGLMLDRVAALVEKAGLPRDRVLSDTDLLAAIRARGDTVETFYYGHDYPASALTRFFQLADQEHVQLNEQEETLRALLTQLGWLNPGADGALITIPRVGADANVTLAARATILRHELSHGEFFSDPAYADYVRRFWRTDLTEQERANVRQFLGSQEYDTSDEDLMLNEMQAYVMFTRDPHFFKASDIGMTDERRAQLQAAFLRGLDVPWLRENLLHPLTGSP